MTWVDTHCHLDAAYFPDGIDGPIERARDAGVTHFVVIGVGETLAPAKNAIALANQYPSFMRAVVGVHPHDAKAVDASMFDELRSLAGDPAVSAVGEIGLDYHYEHSPRDVQKAVFAQFIALAKAVKKPIVIHTREAAEDTLSLLASEGARDVGGIIHCFSEDIPFAKRALDLDFDISFSGIVTFKSAVPIQETAKWVPADRFHLETDSPYLAPIPMRGKPNEPAYLAHTARRVAELRGLSTDALSALCRSNIERRLRTTFEANGMPIQSHG